MMDWFGWLTFILCVMIWCFKEQTRQRLLTAYSMIFIIWLVTLPPPQSHAGQTSHHHTASYSTLQHVHHHRRTSRWIPHYKAELQQHPENMDTWFHLGVSLWTEEIYQSLQTVDLAFNGTTKKVNSKDCFVNYLEMGGKNFEAWSYLANYLSKHQGVIRVNNTSYRPQDCYLHVLNENSRNFVVWDQLGYSLLVYQHRFHRYFNISFNGEFLTPRACFLHSLQTNENTNLNGWLDLSNTMAVGETIELNGRNLTSFQVITRGMEQTLHAGNLLYRGWYTLGDALQLTKTPTAVFHGVHYSALQCFVESLESKETAQGWYQLANSMQDHHVSSVKVGDVDWTRDYCFLKALSMGCRASYSIFSPEIAFHRPQLDEMAKKMTSYFQLKSKSELCPVFFRRTYTASESSTSRSTTVSKSRNPFLGIILLITWVMMVFLFAACGALVQRQRERREMQEWARAGEAEPGDQEMLPSAASILQQLPHPDNGDLQNAQTPEGYHLISPATDCEDDCVICLQSMTSQQCISTPCSHTMHLACLRDYFNHSLRQDQTILQCPICRNGLASRRGFSSSTHGAIVSNEDHNQVVFPVPNSPEFWTRFQAALIRAHLNRRTAESTQGNPTSATTMNDEPQQERQEEHSPPLTPIRSPRSPESDPSPMGQPDMQEVQLPSVDTPVSSETSPTIES